MAYLSSMSIVTHYKVSHTSTGSVHLLTFISHQYVLCILNPFTPKIWMWILLNDFHTFRLVLVLRIWSCTKTVTLSWWFLLFSSPLFLTMYWYCKEKIPVDHSWELKGLRETFDTKDFIWNKLTGRHSDHNPCARVVFPSPVCSIPPVYGYFLDSVEEEKSLLFRYIVRWYRYCLLCFESLSYFIWRSNHLEH